MSPNKLIEKFIHVELGPIIKQVIFNMSNVTVNDSDMNEDFLINFFNQMKLRNYNEWKEVVKCGFEKFLDEHSIPIENIKNNSNEETNELYKLVYECL